MSGHGILETLAVAAAAALLMATLPGVASAEPPTVMNTGQCVAQGFIDRAAYYDGSGSWVYGPWTVRPDGSSATPRNSRGAPFNNGMHCSVPNG